MNTIAERYLRLRKEIGEKATLVAISKYHTVSDIREAYEVGCRDFGESREPELIDKAAQLPADIRWHFIGHLQRNKVKRIIPVVGLIHSVDSPRLLQAIDRHAAEANRTVDCLLQLHVAAEETKFGFTPEELRTFIEQDGLREMQHARIVGLMAMATNTDDEARIKADFRTASETFAWLQEQLGREQVSILSMGMSDDYLLALQERSNMVRIGSAIFGERTM